MTWIIALEKNLFAIQGLKIDKGHDWAQGRTNKRHGLGLVVTDKGDHNDPWQCMIEFYVTITIKKAWLALPPPPSWWPL